MATVTGTDQSAQQLPTAKKLLALVFACRYHSAIVLCVQDELDSPSLSLWASTIALLVAGIIRLLCVQDELDSPSLGANCCITGRRYHSAIVCTRSV